MENGRFRSDDVITKLKDDGHFDKLRLKIIRKLKDNEELRKSIISTVKQSAVLSRPGAENMKPRQLSDAIHEEVGEKVMSQISDHLWGIIQSGDGMKNEITETVQSVYGQLLNPKGSENGESSLNNDPISAPATEINGAYSDCEPDEPPGFAPSKLSQNGKISYVEQPKEDTRIPSLNDGKVPDDCKVEALRSADFLDTKKVEVNSVPVVTGSTQPTDYSDEDPDVPPGFG